MRTYESIRTDAIIKRKASDTNDWALGDLFKEAEDLTEGLKSKFTKDKGYEPTEEERDFSMDARKLLERLADDIGMAKKAVFLRARISRRVDPTGLLGWIRTSTLTYSAMRELYAVEDDNDLNTVAKKAVSQNMTIREIRSEMENYRAGKAVDSGLVVCRTCGEKILEPTNIVGLSHHSNRYYFCGWNCASIYALTQASEETPIPTKASAVPGDQMEDEIDLSVFDWDESSVVMAV